jgi:hypothetical protein
MQASQSRQKSCQKNLPLPGTWGLEAKSLEKKLSLTDAGPDRG